jgi:hypothetical protein
MYKKMRLAAFAVSLGVACTPAAAAYTSIFAFGDSLSDAFSPKTEARGPSRLTSVAISATVRPGWKTCRKCWALAR